MTRKVTLLALAIAALLIPTGSAAAAPSGELKAASGQTIRSSAFGELTSSRARRLAVRLARQTARSRDVRWWQLARVGAVAPKRVTFDYADRSRDNVYCTASIVVEQPSEFERRSRFVGGTCRGVPSEALAIERATARFIKAVRADAVEIYETRFDIATEIGECARVRVPRNRRADVATLFDAHQAYRFGGQLTAPLNAFVTELEAINPQAAALASAARYWKGFDQAGFNIGLSLIAPEEGTEARDEPCRAIRRWAAAGWTAGSSPAFFGDLRSELRTMAANENGLIRVARALAALGVSPRAALAITPAGVLDVAAPPVPETCSNPRVGCPSPG